MLGGGFPQPSSTRSLSLSVTFYAVIGSSFNRISLLFRQRRRGWMERSIKRWMGIKTTKLYKRKKSCLGLNWVQCHGFRTIVIIVLVLTLLPGSCYNFGWTVYFSSSSSVCMLNWDRIRLRIRGKKWFCVCIAYLWFKNEMKFMISPSWKVFTS